MGFITLKPEGYYRGKKNTKQMMIDWVLEESHVINGVKIEVTQARLNIRLFQIDFGCRYRCHQPPTYKNLWEQ